MRHLLLTLTVLALALTTGCDSGGGGDDDDDGGSAVNCSAIGALEGSLGGSATTGSVSANCFNIDTSGGRFSIIALDVPSLTVVPRTTLLVALDDDETGTYTLGGDSRNLVQYTPSGTSGFDAEVGTFTLTEFSASRVRGTFEFTTVNGIEVTNGTLDVRL